MHPKHKECHTELLAQAWLLENGYEVFENVRVEGSGELGGVRDTEVLVLDVKSHIETSLSGEQRAAGILQLAAVNGRFVLRGMEQLGEAPCANPRCGLTFIISH